MFTQSLFLVLFAAAFVQAGPRFDDAEVGSDATGNLVGPEYGIEGSTTRPRIMTSKYFQEPKKAQNDGVQMADTDHLMKNASHLIHKVLDKFSASVATHLTDAFKSKIDNVVDICQGVVEKGRNESYLVSHVQKGIDSMITSVGHAAIKRGMLSVLSKFL